MRRWAKRWPWILVLSGFLTPTFAQNLNAVGYVGWWVAEGWKSVRQVAFDRLFVFELPIGEAGDIPERHGWPERWGELIEHAQSKKIPVDLTITLMDPQRFQRVFGSPQAIERLSAELVALASDARVAGIQLDVELYEGVPAPALLAYRQFVRTLADQLKTLNPRRQLGIFLPFQSKNLLYDAESLRSVDYSVIQGYDSHWLDSKRAGPVAPLDGPYALTWKKAIALADRLEIPRSKQYLGYPLYGYEWRVRDGRSTHSLTMGKGITVTFARPLSVGSLDQTPPSEAVVVERVARYGASYDAVSASSSYRFRGTDGYWREGWFDDWWGMHAKAAFVLDNQLPGLAFFLLGYDGGTLVDYYHRHAPAGRTTSSQQ
ncbi:glycosyl hydrolase family 18 protein [Curvibacter sp. APW13]|uniref:glycosyl hydrolase family 18 protein n=1 Tax=Curvibacter sp. APW13 TaxID=3077236 RepID=UPI0028E02EF3|nr:glycosyl hydrolase family 18 protein [Curvibacter sp. APW13]MDT8990056.1 glycosyl hydrolase family 18 protein [Curvibacter sp. APW13]